MQLVDAGSKVLAAEGVSTGEAHGNHDTRQTRRAWAIRRRAGVEHALSVFHGHLPRK